LFAKLALFAFIIDRLFGEFQYIKHPVVLMGEWIEFVEKRFYRDSILAGLYPLVSLLLISFIISYTTQEILLGFGVAGFIILSIIASTTIASKMLYDSVLEVLKDKRYIRFLVSRDTENLSNSEIYKASIETYAENLSDGVVAPLFYLLLFGLPGAICYKAINTLDSMIGYRDSRYERYGKLSAKLDDIANYIPARVTMLMIWICSKPKVSLKDIIKDAKGHSSPNAGYPISAMAYRVGVSLGGDTSYFGKIVHKPYFGRGSKSIKQKDVYKALGVRVCIEVVVIVIIGIIGVWG